MSTRSAVGIFTEKVQPGIERPWHARYVHSDGYPSGVGRWLFLEYKRAYSDGNLRTLTSRLMAEPCGWSELVNRDLTKDSTWDMESILQMYRDAKTQEDFNRIEEFRRKQGPTSYYKRGEWPTIGTVADGGDYILSGPDHDKWGTEWAYIFDEDESTMHVFKVSSYTNNVTRVAIVYLNGDEPDWKKIEDYTA